MAQQSTTLAALPEDSGMYVCSIHSTQMAVHNSW